MVSEKIAHYVRHSRLLWRTPGVIPAVMAGYFKVLVLRKPVLRTLEFAITPHCNVNCTMCYATKLVDRERKMLSPDEIAAIWQQAKRLGAFSAHLSGGEPTLRKDLGDIIEALEPSRTIISMTSNSTILFRADLDRLRRHGLSVLHLSLNDVDPVRNDVERDFQGHFQRTIQTVMDAKAAGFEVCLSIVVAHGGLDSMRRLTDFAREQGIGVVFSLATPAGNWAGGTEFLLSPEEWEEVDAYMLDNPHVRSDWTINLSLKKRCPAGYEKVAISPYGDVQGCAMSFISHGNLRDRPLADIWRDMMRFGPYAKRSPRCLIALDREYIEDYLIPVNSANVLPVPLDRHPVRPERL